MFKILLVVSALSNDGEYATRTIARVENMDTCENMLVLMNRGPQPDDKTVIFSCKPE